ncbi:MAG: flagellar biosynthesis protein FlhF [Terriglobia bacterium]
MKVKTYRAATIKQALEQIKRELGPDAFILNRKEIPGKKVLGFFGKSHFEITAAVDYSQVKTKVEKNRGMRLADVQDRLELSKEVAIGARQQAPPADELSPTPIPMTMSSEARRLIHEIRDLKILIQATPEGESRPRSPKPSLTGFAQPGQQEIYIDLLSQEVEPELAYELVKKVVASEKSRLAVDPMDHYKKIHGYLARRIKVDKQTLMTKRTETPVIFALLGPTGVGKTTTLAKLAAKAVLDGKLKVGLITMDTFRIAAVEQLKTYAEIIGVPTKVVESAREMELAIQAFSDKHVILIDTAGKSRRELRNQQELAELMATHSSIRKALVLSATTKLSDLVESMDSYRMFNPNCVIFTKLDETCVYGPMLSALVKGQHPLAFVTTGQNVPKDIVKPTSKSIAALVLKTAAESTQDPIVQLQRECTVPLQKKRNASTKKTRDKTPSVGVNDSSHPAVPAEVGLKSCLPLTLEHQAQ